MDGKLLINSNVLIYVIKKTNGVACRCLANSLCKSLVSDAGSLVDSNGNKLSNSVSVLAYATVCAGVNGVALSIEGRSYNLACYRIVSANGVKTVSVIQAVTVSKVLACDISEGTTGNKLFNRYIKKIAIEVTTGDSDCQSIICFATYVNCCSTTNKLTICNAYIVNILVDIKSTFITLNLTSIYFNGVGAF